MYIWGVGYLAKKILWEKTKSYVEQRYTTPNVYMGGRVPGKKNPMGKNKIIRRTTLYDPKCIYVGGGRNRFGKKSGYAFLSLESPHPR